MAPEWYIAKDKQRTGPFPLQHLKQLVATGQLAATDMLLQPGSTKWMKVEDVPGLIPVASAIAAEPASIANDRVDSVRRDASRAAAQIEPQPPRNSSAATFLPLLQRRSLTTLLRQRTLWVGMAAGIAAMVLVTLIVAVAAYSLGRLRPSQGSDQEKAGVIAKAAEKDAKAPVETDAPVEPQKVPEKDATQAKQPQGQAEGASLDGKDALQQWKSAMEKDLALARAAVEEEKSRRLDREKEVAELRAALKSERTRRAELERKLNAGATDPGKMKGVAEDDDELILKFKIKVSLAVQRLSWDRQEVARKPGSRIEGVEDGVLRAFAVAPTLRTQLLLFAVGEMHSPGKGVDLCKRACEFTFSEESARKSYEADDKNDFYGRAAIQYASAIIIRRQTQWEIEEINKSTLDDEGRRVCLTTFRKMQGIMAAEFDRNFSKLVGIGLKDLLRKEPKRR